MEICVKPLVGVDYACLEDSCDVNSTLLNEWEDNEEGCVVSGRGVCYNSLTKCLVVCDAMACCVRCFPCYPTSLGRLQYQSYKNMKIGIKGVAPGCFQCPVAVDVNKRGEVVVGDSKLNRVQLFTGGGTFASYFGKTGSSRGEFRGICDLKFTPNGQIAVVDGGNHRIQIFTPSGGCSIIIGTLGIDVGQLKSPIAIDIGNQGDYFILEQGNKRIQRFTSKGRYLSMWGSKRVRAEKTSEDVEDMDEMISSKKLLSSFDKPSDVCCSKSGEVVVCDENTNELYIYSTTGDCIHRMHLQNEDQPIAVTYCHDVLVVVARMNKVLEEAKNEEAFSIHVYPPGRNRRMGAFSNLSIPFMSEILEYMTYDDAIQIRTTCKYVCQVLKQLRDAWLLHPFTPGSPSVMKHGRCVTRATGLVNVIEAFKKWGTRVVDCPRRLQYEVMDYDSGFIHAISDMYGPKFIYQHEHELQCMFQFVSSADGEINRSHFIELLTQIEEVRHGYFDWAQCPALRHHPLQQDKRQVSNYELLKRAEHRHLNNLLNKLDSLRK